MGVLTMLNGGIITKTFFKETDRTGYIPTASCHHPKWLGAIPKGQLMHIPWNCTNLNDYVQQSELVVNRFKEKGNHNDLLVPIQAQVTNMDRQCLLRDKLKKSNNHMNKIAFLTNFNRDYRSLEHIVRRYWPILLRDKALAGFLPKQPTFIYRRAPTLRYKISPNIYNPPKKLRTFLDTTGFYYCKWCKACRTTTFKNRKTFQSHSTGKQFNIDKFIFCDSTHVTYLISCPCGLQYMGRMFRKLGIRIN